MKVLIVEDDRNICNIVGKYFENEQFEVCAMYNGEDALSFIEKNSVDLVILDLMLPGISGYQVCAKVREKNAVPVIMLTAKGEINDKIDGFETGADDYVVKPFDPKELIARARAILRRTSLMKNPSDANEEKTKNTLKFKSLVIDKDSFAVYLEDENVILPRREFQLLEFLAANANKVFSRSQLIDTIWGWDFEGDDRVIDLYIERLRKRLKTEKGINWSIKTVWGVGYKFEVSD